MFIFCGGGDDMKFYIASSFKNINQVRNLSAKLQSKGFVQTYDWTQNGRASSYEELQQVGQEEKQAVANSDFLVILLPAGKGSHIEFGIALGLGKRIYICAPEKNYFDFSETSTFYHVDGVQHFIGELEDFASHLVEEEIRGIQR